MTKQSVLAGIHEAWRSVWAEKLILGAGDVGHVVHSERVGWDNSGNGVARGVSNVFLHPKFRHRSGTIDAATQAGLRIVNHERISVGYGAEAARQAHAQILARLQVAIGDHGVAAPAAAGVVDVLLWDAAAVCGSDAPAAISSWQTRMARELMLEPVQTLSGPIHVAIGNCFADSLRDQRSNEPLGQDSAAKSAQTRSFRTDMAQVSPIMRALREDGGVAASGNCRPVEVLWCPIVSTSDGAGAAIFEASLGLIGGNGVVEAIDDALASIDRLGFSQIIDHYIVSRVVEELASQSSPTLLVSVSVSSFRRAEDWVDILSALAARPNIAPRLVIELRGGSSQEDWHRAGEVLSKFRRLGAQIAIGNFATGELPIKQLILQRPQFITIDSRILRSGCMLDGDGVAFAQLVDLARALGAEPIVSGIDDETSSMLATSLNAKFWKGPMLAAARVCRPWVTGCSHWRINQ